MMTCGASAQSALQLFWQVSLEDDLICPPAHAGETRCPPVTFSRKGNGLMARHDEREAAQDGACTWLASSAAPRRHGGCHTRGAGVPWPRTCHSRRVNKVFTALWVNIPKEGKYDLCRSHCFHLSRYIYADFSVYCHRVFHFTIHLPFRQGSILGRSGWLATKKRKKRNQKQCTRKKSMRNDAMRVS